MNTPVSFELAKLLKEKGFDEDCYRTYSNGKISPFPLLENMGGEPILNPLDYKWKNSSIHYSLVTAPTIAEVVMWSFNTHKIWITVDVNINGKFNYLLRQFNSKDRAWEVRNPSSIKEYFNNPDDAYSSGITYFLNNLEMSK